MPLHAAWTPSSSAADGCLLCVANYAVVIEDAPAGELVAAFPLLSRPLLHRTWVCWFWGFPRTSRLMRRNTRGAKRWCEQIGYIEDECSPSARTKGLSPERSEPNDPEPMDAIAEEMHGQEKDQGDGERNREDEEGENNPHANEGDDDQDAEHEDEEEEQMTKDSTEARSGSEDEVTHDGRDSG